MWNCYPKYNPFFRATGIILLALIAKYVQHWRYIQLAINIPTLATIFYIW